MEVKYNENGGIGAYKDFGTRSFVQTYTHNEVAIDYIDSQDLVHPEFIRLRIGTNEGKQIIVLQNGKFYMINGFATSVKDTDELSAAYIFEAIDDIAKLNKTIGNLLNLHTIQKVNLVEAINEVSQRSSTPRILQGYIKYLSDGQEPDDLQDLDIRFNTTNQRFEYYSDLGEWVLLPYGWQRLTNIVRTRNDLPERPIERIVYGILEESILVEYKNGEWVECVIPVDQFGDEYIVQFVYNREFNGNANGSVIYTPKGWVYLINYNN